MRLAELHQLIGMMWLFAMITMMLTGSLIWGFNDTIDEE